MIAMVAIIIPSYNEKQNIQPLVEKILTTSPKAHIIIVDDNSPDNTKAEIKRLQSKFSRLHIVLRKRKGGRGSAVLAGFHYAQKTIKPLYYIEMDADLSHNISELPKMISLSKPKNVVLASRYLKKSKLVNVTSGRKVMSKVSNALIRIILQTKLHDNTNGYRCYQEDAIEILMKHNFISSGYIVLSESAFILGKKGFSFVEYPSRFVNRRFGKSNASMKEFFSSLLMLQKIRSLKV